MTAEVAIITKNEIILASDKAITTPNEKTYNNANKIFNLSNELPVAIMINGYIDFENILLESLISEFKNSTDFKKLKTIENIKNEFLTFLSKNTSHTKIEDYLKWKLYQFKQELSNEILEYGFDEILSHYPQKEVLSIVKNLDNFDTEFYNIIPKEKDKKKYNLKIWEIFCYDLTFEGSGIIFVGFDIDSYYPSIFELNIHCNNHGEIIYENIYSKIKVKTPIIKVFAINEEAYAFLTGINNDFEDYVKQYNEQSKKEFLENLKNYLKFEEIHLESIEKIINISKDLLESQNENFNVLFEKHKNNALKYTSEASQYLPRALLCDLANYLIQLTALKQKISSELETVSIETDIAVLTKANNFN